MEGTPSAGWRRIVVWLYTIGAAVVVAGVFLQAFSIASYVRGAGQGARDLHETGGFLTHSIEIVVFLLALVAFWGAWRASALRCCCRSSGRCRFSSSATPTRAAAG